MAESHQHIPRAAPKGTWGDLSGQRGDQITRVTRSTSPINPLALHLSLEACSRLLLHQHAASIPPHPQAETSSVGFTATAFTSWRGRNPTAEWLRVGWRCSAAGYVYPCPTVSPPPLTVSTSSRPTKLFCSINAPQITPAPPGRCPSPQ